VLFHDEEEHGKENKRKNIFRVFILDYKTPELNMKFDTFFLFNVLEKKYNME
jgi:hypothetical protein